VAIRRRPPRFPGSRSAGATTYYLEIFPAQRGQLGGREPVMSLTPSPGNVDVMVASELLEAGRALQNGFVSPDRTTLVASTHRIYATVEKMQRTDGRFPEERVLAAAQQLAKRTVLFDMRRMAEENGTVINAVLFGAVAGSGALPLAREACEKAILRAGKGAQASLRGFAAGYDIASGTRAPPPPAARPLPPATREILELGAARLRDYQGEAYARLYLERIASLGNVDPQLIGETGRQLALWMSYEDVIRVADLKSRRSRFERVRAEVQPKPGEPVHIVEYLKPGLEEAAALLPPGLSKRLVAWAEKRGLTHKLNVGMHVKSSSVFGFLLLRLLASLRPLRRLSARYAEEQALIERWLAAIAAAPDAELAFEIALCGRLIKGYGDTNQRAKANFLRIFDTLVNGSAVPDSAARARR